MSPERVSGTLRLMAWVVFIAGVALTLLAITQAGLGAGLVSAITLLLGSIVIWGVLMGLSALITVMVEIRDKQV